MTNEYRDLARMFKALADENRLKILALIREGELRCECTDDGCDDTRCMKEIGKSLDITQATVSHHTKELVDAGLITTQKKGKWVYCQVDEEGIGKLCEFLERFTNNQNKEA